MSCRATFNFIKGPCIGRVITHDFDAGATVAHMKQYLQQEHGACDPRTHSLALVWEEQGVKLTDDTLAAAALGSVIGITVNVVKKGETPITPKSPCSSTQAPHPAPSPTAPSPSLTPGCRVRIHSLVAKPHLNARTATLHAACDAATGRCTVRLEGSGSSAQAEDLVSIRLENLEIITASEGLAAGGPACATSDDAACSGAHLQPPAAHAAPAPAVAPPTPPPATEVQQEQQAIDLQQGQRVIITGLQAKPEMNGATGVICDVFNAQTGRWTVQIDSAPPARGSFRPGNLRRVPPLDQGKVCVCTRTHAYTQTHARSPHSNHRCGLMNTAASARRP